MAGTEGDIYKELSIPRGVTPLEYLSMLLVYNGVKGLEADDYSSFGYLKGMVEKRIAEVYPSMKEEIRHRVDNELDSIDKENITDLFLVLQDVRMYAEKQDISLSPTHDTFTGSIAAYCLGVTDTDPVKSNLTFDGFVNENGLKGIHMEVEFGRRQQIISHIEAEFGDEMPALLEALNVRFDEMKK